MRRIIKRRWFSKKKQAWVEKEYVYNYKKSTRGRILVDKNGKINQKNINKLKQQIETQYDTTVSNYLKDELDRIVEEKHNIRNHKELRTTGFWGRLEDNSVTRMFSNMGQSLDDVADMYGLDPNDLLNEDNWNFSDNTFTDPVTGNVLNFQFSYTDSIFF